MDMSSWHADMMPTSLPLPSPPLSPPHPLPPPLLPLLLEGHATTDLGLVVWCSSRHTRGRCVMATAVKTSPSRTRRMACPTAQSTLRCATVSCHIRHMAAQAMGNAPGAFRETAQETTPVRPSPTEAQRRPLHAGTGSLLVTAAGGARVTSGTSPHVRSRLKRNVPLPTGSRPRMGNHGLEGRSHNIQRIGVRGTGAPGLPRSLSKTSPQGRS